MPDPWQTGDVNGMMSQLTASTPTPSPDPNMPPGFDTSAGGGDPTSGNVDWSWLTNFFKSDPNARLGGRAAMYGPAGRYGRPPSGDDPVGKWLSGLFTQSPQDQLTQAIYDKMGIGNYGPHDPKRIRMIIAAQQAAQKAQHDASYRQQLSTWLGWDQNNPHVQYWIANGGGIPDKPTQKDAPIGGQATGVTGTGQQPASATDPSTAKVQVPFDAKYFNDPNYQGNNYGDPLPAGAYWGGWQWHQGQDYGVPQGTALSFPFAGKVTKVGYDPNGYGNYVTVTFGDQGLQMTYAHLSYVQVKQGDTLTPGQQVALSGGAGPGSGISTGSHLLVVLQDARGNPLDPRPLLQEVYSGATLGQMQKLGIASTGSPNATGSYTTPDGHVIWPGTPDDAYYSMVSTVYEHYYGTKPPWSMVMAMRQSGIQNTDQMAAVAANWPSDIPGISFGQRENIYNTANGIAVKNWGRPIPDALVKQLATAGRTSNDDIKEWFDTHIPTDLPAADYQQIYDATNPMFQKTYGQGPSPEYIGYLWGQTQVQPTVTGTTPATTPPVTTQK